MKNRKHVRRIKRLALVCTLCTVILIVSTYAWFVGMKTVNVSSFNVEIAATEGLSLSLNGKYFAESVSINSDNYKYDATKVETEQKENYIYNGSTNTWGGNGLVPVSTIGKINTTSSRLIMYEKGSITVTDGGYRLMASEVANHTVADNVEEGTGFVAFDLFVKNLSGNAYYPEFNKLNEEAIYLTRESAVKVVTVGSDKQDKTGIENSVRVAFAQIGRVAAEKPDNLSDTKYATKVETIQKLTCANAENTDATKSTGLCGRDATIWEPNDTKHVQNAIEWYNKSCKGRTGSTVSGTTAAYSGSCGAVSDGSAVTTYAIGEEIKNDHNNEVDVYDGATLNGYANTTSGTSGASFTPLHAMNYFTDTEKMQTGLQRPEFISLAPNSITKIRVYIFLEGQDVDNYDFASLGKTITVNFGLTKERFFEGDIPGYDGPTSVTKGDQTITVPTTAGEQS